MSKELVSFIRYDDQFGICPKCGKPLMLLRAEYTAYVLAPSGYIQSQVDEKSEMKRICPACGYSDICVATDHGILPEEYVNESVNDSNKPIKNNPIG